jgi:hypothetical protein
MTWGPADKLNRTAKILIDSGKAGDPTEAAEYLRSLVLQVAVGPEIDDQPAAQAALATAVNVGRRAYHGGVHVRLQTDPRLDTGWTAGLTASELVSRYGGTIVNQLDPERPTLVIGGPEDCVGRPHLYCTWRQWAGGVVQSADAVLGADGIVPAGILAAALGVSEAFQQELGYVVAGRRDIGISLWQPDVSWRAAEPGPPLEYLPSALWLLGLGHLGQAYAWTTGMLPYAQPADVDIGLLDFDSVIDGNISTQLLVTAEDVGKRKTRIVSAGLEGLGLRTRLVERAFDEHFHPVAHANPNRNEPMTALAGFDDIAPRRDLGKVGFGHIVDAGLGAGPIEYLDMVLHSFPNAGDPALAFPDELRTPRPLRDAYEREIARQVEGGTDETAARCGMLDIAGVTVGAAFVGAVASTLVVADVLRRLHDGASYNVIALDLRSPDGIRAVRNVQPVDHVLPPYTRVR